MHLSGDDPPNFIFHRIAHRLEHSAIFQNVSKDIPPSKMEDLIGTQYNSKIGDYGTKLVINYINLLRKTNQLNRSEKIFLTQQEYRLRAFYHKKVLRSGNNEDT